MDNVSQKPERRYDIDWLRVILFGLLIPFHVAIGVYWSTYGEDINPNITDDPDDRKEIAEEGNDYTYDSVDPTSMFLHWMHQWRLAALFMISGMGTAFAFKRRSWKTFLTERLQRLLVPMFFGMWTVGFAGGIITGSADLEGNTVSDTLIAFVLHVFLTSFVFWVPLFGKIIALGHLWFLWNLFLYSLLCVPIFHIVQKNVDGTLATALRSIFTIRFGLGIFILFPTLLAITELMFKPWFPGFIGIGYEWVWYLAFFLFGYICIISRDRYYEFLDTNRKVITVVTMLLTIAFVIIRLQQHEDGVPYMDGGWIEQGIFHNEMTVLGCFIHSFHAWFWCLTIFAWGSHLLNKKSSSLTYLNQGVYPFYIVHMPITFAGLKIAKELNFTGIPAVIAGCLIVLIGCWLVFEGVSRTRITRYLFGIKNIQQKQSVVTQDVS
ncbi:MAG: hypothetical protein CMA18_003875 [Methanobacteriota archaeon]|nr:MAG: hypothetical protein CBC63_03360 [Euryarchaeota archaeon TMED103]RAH11362.1 MAG: hypothetical protein CMA18_003875 [Euryarchaeota archaeon]